MSLLNDLFSTTMMGEPERLDYIIKEHQQLRHRVSQLEALLKSKGILTDDELTHLAIPLAGHEG